MRCIFISLIALFPLSAFAADLAENELSASETQAVNQGEIIVHVWRDETRDDRAINVLGVMDIKAPPAVIWNIMTDCARSEIIVSNMKSCEVVEQGEDGLWDIRVQKTKVNFFITHTSRFRSDYDRHKSIKISRAGGDMKVQEGIWALSPITPGTTRLTYHAASAPSFPVSQSKMIKTSNENLPEILSNLRREAEADFDSLK